MEQSTFPRLKTVEAPIRKACSFPYLTYIFITFFIPDGDSAWLRSGLIGCDSSPPYGRFKILIQLCSNQRCKLEVGKTVSAPVPHLFCSHTTLMYSWFCFMVVCSVNTTLRRMEVISAARQTGCFRLASLKMTNSGGFSYMNIKMNFGEK